MKRTLVSFILALTIFGALAVAATTSTINSNSIEFNTDTIKKKIETMTDEEKVGQMLIFGFNGTQVNDDVKTLFKDQHLGGVILYGWRNFYGKTINENVNFINDLKKANSENNNIPLFISFDEEGGALSHLPGDLLKTPYKGEIGNLNNGDLAQAMGECTGKKLNALGINLDFGTVLDINTNPQNPVIGIRSYGSTKEKVSELGARELKGIKSQNIIATLKHFPGHGDTSTDSHLGLPKIDHDIERLRTTELVPFQKGIDNGADMIMTAHIVASKIDSENPATLSKKILTDLLRKDMNYKGVIITDDLEMAAITKNFDLGEAAVKSVEAGADILLVCHTKENQKKVYAGLLKAVKEKRISKEKLNESVERILSLKEKYNLKDTPKEPIKDFFSDTNKFVHERLKMYFKLVVKKMY